MKRLLVLVAVAFGAVALYAVTAPAGERAVTPGQITAINKKISTLQKQVKAVTGDLGFLENCIDKHVVAMTEYSGFQYQQSGGTVITTTAIATTDQGDTVQFYVLTVTPQCAKTIGVAASGKAARPLRRP
jgi:hypothetical protein